MIRRHDMQALWDEFRKGKPVSLDKLHSLTKASPRQVNDYLLRLIVGGYVTPEAKGEVICFKIVRRCVAAPEPLENGTARPLTVLEKVWSALLPVNVIDTTVVIDIIGCTQTAVYDALYKLKLSGYVTNPSYGLWLKTRRFGPIAPRVLHEKKKLFEIQDGSTGEVLWRRGDAQ